ncbi:MAG: hypothetical protein AAFX99_25895 [Myxococcota bacterium]
MSSRRHHITGVCIALLCTLGTLTVPTSSHADDVPEQLKSPKGEIAIDSDTTLRFIMWGQFWTRFMQLNPGTLIQGSEEDTSFDVGIRRARFLAWAQNGRTQTMFHFGINNETFQGPFPAFFVHDAWGSYAVVEKMFNLGMGLHYWRGISRMTSASTLNFLALDAPILNWPTIARTDQFARDLGIFAHGQIDRIDYRFSLNRPFVVNAMPTAGGPGDYNPQANSINLEGYVQLFLNNGESGALPYTVGTYLGKKDVFNIGAGFQWQPDGIAQVDAEGNLEEEDLLALGADVFLDKPLGRGSALTAYVVYYNFQLGEDNVRNVGIMNLGSTTDADGNPTADASVNGPGNAYPVIGTGNHIYGQVGYLLPNDGTGVLIQPYVTTQYSLMDGLDDPMIAPEVGINWYLDGQYSKVTTHFRNRPLFKVEGDEIKEDSRLNEFILQFHVRL